MKQLVFLISILTFSSLAVQAAGVRSKMSQLGGNEEIAQKAKSWEGNNKIRVVQKRSVDRNWRLEMGVNYGVMAGGDPYASTQNYGGNLDVHINPHWSVGARYYKYYSDLTPEGERVLSDFVKNAENGNSNLPGMVFPLESSLAVVSFYPLYGKINMFDMGIAQFDLYMLGGYGETRLSSGSAPTWTAGGGVGLWLSQHFTSRLEVRYQHYQDKIYTGPRDIDSIVSTLSIGFML